MYIFVQKNTVTHVYFLSVRFKLCKFIFCSVFAALCFLICVFIIGPSSRMLQSQNSSGPKSPAIMVIEETVDKLLDLEFSPKSEEEDTEDAETGK